MHTPFSLVLGMTYTYLPFMVLPLYGNLAKMDLRLLEAAADLGATPWVAFWKVTVPLSKAGIIAGSMLVFIPCVGEFVIPELLGGPETLMIGRVLWDEFFSNNDWPMASTVAVVMILLIIVPLAIFNKYQAEAQEHRDEGCGASTLVRPRLAVGGLRVPVPAHRGAGRLFVQRLAAAQRVARLHAEVVRAAAGDTEMVNGLWLSLKIAFLTACGSVVLGTLAAFALVKYRRFRGRTLFSGMVNAPLVMPEVVVGLSLLLMLVSDAACAGLPRARPLHHLAGPPAAGHGLCHGGGAGAPAGPEPAAGRSRDGPGRTPVAGVLAGDAAHDRAVHGVGLAADLHHLARRRRAVGLPVGARRHHHAAGHLQPRRLGLNPSVNAVATITVVLVAIGVVVASYLIARAERRRALEMAAAARA
jgi:ABC-type spermidine/putrescine transport system permease subunit I